MFVLIASYLLLVFLLPVALSAVIGYRSLPRGRTCPDCGGDTIPLLKRYLQWLSSVNRQSAVQRRWCYGCGWEGLQRVPRRTAADSAARVRPTTERTSPAADRTSPTADRTSPKADRTSPAADRTSSQQTPAPPGTATHTLNVRSLEVDGSAWRVMLQCWTNTGLLYGRLVFVSPAGRLWLDAVESFTGTDETEALVQVRALPEPLLTHRLRRLALRHEA